MHELAVATGCTIVEALTVCILLYHYHVAEIFLLLNRRDLEVNPIYRAKLSDGPPQLPFYNDDNDIEIDSLDGIEYDFHFTLDTKAEFILQP